MRYVLLRRLCPSCRSRVVFQSNKQQLVSFSRRKHHAETFEFLRNRSAASADVRISVSPDSTQLENHQSRAERLSCKFLSTSASAKRKSCAPRVHATAYKQHGA